MGHVAALQQLCVHLLAEPWALRADVDCWCQTVPSAVVLRTSVTPACSEGGTELRFTEAKTDVSGWSQRLLLLSVIFCFVCGMSIFPTYICNLSWSDWCIGNNLYFSKTLQIHLTEMSWYVQSTCFNFLFTLFLARANLNSNL